MKNKILIILMLCFCLCGCGNYRELNDMAIITVVSIDKADDKYEMSFLIANARNSQTTSKEGQAQTTVYSGKGKTLTEAAEHIDFKSPKKLYLGHVNVVVISEEIGREGFLKIADFLMRYPETRKQFFLIQAKDCKAKEILNMVSPLESFPSQHIASLLKTGRDSESVIQIVDYASFVSKSLDEGVDPMLPAIKIIGDPEKGGDEKNLESTKQKAYLKLESVAIYRNDKFVDYLDFSNNLMVNIINNKVHEMKTIFKYKNNKIGLTSDNLKTEVKIKNYNTVNINISGEGSITEINANIDLENTNTLTEMEKALNNNIKKRCKKVIEKMQKKYHTDVFGFGNKLYKSNPKTWKKIENKWNDKYFPNLKINIKSNIKITKAGSLNRTIQKEET